MHPTIAKLTSTGPAVSDGAWGTQLQQRGLAVGACPDAWNLTQPKKVEEVALAMGITREEYVAIEHGKDPRGLQMAFQTLLHMPPTWVSADQCSAEVNGYQYLPN